MTLGIKSLVAVGGSQCINLKDSMEKSLIEEGCTEKPPLSSKGKEGKSEAAWVSGISKVPTARVVASASLPLKKLMNHKGFIPWAVLILTRYFNFF